LFYETDFAMWHDWVNCFIELTGQHRFKKDPVYGAIMKRIHDGCPTDSDIDLINSRVLNGNHPDDPKMEDIPKDVAYAVYRNVDKSAINNGVFAEHLRNTHSTNPLHPLPFHTLIVHSDDLMTTKKWECARVMFFLSDRLLKRCGCSPEGSRYLRDDTSFIHWKLP
jgi:hypothetical protein